ncbi:hypothetical protein D3C78_1307660 [compost metagenome]
MLVDLCIYLVPLGATGVRYSKLAAQESLREYWRARIGCHPGPHGVSEVLDQKSHFLNGDLLRLLGQSFRNSASGQAAKEAPAPQVHWSSQINGIEDGAFPEHH